ncbi:heavy metal sensor histidine kinase [Solimonas marina]|uniref:Sensor protein n=1 Tax=Solimonas marina TaxID=2714601 RepID=A0A969W8X6_9GAMM|nr:heavy metal sensor histidine kinase [Solimonas marina]NKF22802.1 heavy metal sensor histidine kinase [Solimonas marina]
MTRMSIAWRLSAMFAGVALLIFALVGIALDQVLRAELDRQKANELDTKYRIGEQLIEHCPTADSWHFAQARLDGLSSGDDGTYFWVTSIDSRFTYGDLDQLGRLMPSLPDGLSSRASTRNHEPMNFYAGEIEAADQRPRTRLIVAIDAEPYAHTLHTFAAALALLSAIGVALAAMLGLWVARVGLSPLARLSREAQALSPRQLSHRLELAPLPQELSELKASFNGALDRLERAYVQLQAFNADVAHELRTPLSNLIGQTEVALAKPRSPLEFADVLQSNLEELARLRAIVNDMLFLARVDEGEMADRRRQVSLAAEVGKSLEFMDVVLDEAGLAVEVDGDAQADINGALFGRAITNLLQNAVQHATSPAPIRVRIEAGAGAARVSVSNAGEPIPDEHIGRLFDRFYRVDPSRGSDGASHGLGLAIVKAVATMHNGIVFAESRDGINTIGFTLGDRAPS